MNRLDNVGRFYNGPTEIVRLGECFKFVPTCSVLRTSAFYRKNSKNIFRINAKFSKCQKKFCEMSESDKRTKMVSLQFITVIIVRMNSEYIGGIN